MLFTVLCGNPALLQVGGLSNVFPSRNRNKVYDIKQLFQTFYRHYSNALVIEAGLCQDLLKILNGVVCIINLHCTEYKFYSQVALLVLHVAM